MRAWLPFTDPPHQTALRRALAGPLRTQLTNRLRPEIEGIVAEVVHALPAGSPIDVVDAFARVVPQRVAGTLLDISADEAAAVAAWATDVGRSLSPFLGRADLARIEGSIVALTAFVERLIDARRASPGADIVSDLIEAQTTLDLTDADLVGLVLFTLAASQETSTAVLAAAVHLLAHHPEQLEQARAAGAWRQVADEAMRLESPVQMTMRRATEDQEVGGARLPAGSHVLVVLGAANRDEAAFEQTDQFVVDRPENPHLAFGAGPHTCPGAAIAHTELQAALEALFDRFHEVTAAGEPTWESSLTLRSMRSLPVRLEE